MPALIKVDEIWTKNYIQKLFKTGAIFLGKGTVCLCSCQNSYQERPFFKATQQLDETINQSKIPI